MGTTGGLYQIDLMACLATKKFHACYIPVVYRQECLFVTQLSAVKSARVMQSQLCDLKYVVVTKKEIAIFCNYIDITNKTGFCPDLMMVIAFPVY